VSKNGNENFEWMCVHVECKCVSVYLHHKEFA
jgi:hypothetical protein